MSAGFTPYVEGSSSSFPGEVDAFIRVRVTQAPRPDGSMLVYLPNGTAVVVDSRCVLCFDRDPGG